LVEGVVVGVVDVLEEPVGVRHTPDGERLHMQGNPADPPQAFGMLAVLLPGLKVEANGDAKDSIELPEFCFEAPGACAMVAFKEPDLGATGCGLEGIEGEVPSVEFSG
jgi:hypothetical protein